MEAELELVVPARPPPRAVKPRGEKKEEPSLELAVDPRELLAQRSGDAYGGGGMHEPPPGGGPVVAAAASAQVHRERAAPGGYRAPPPSFGGRAAPQPPPPGFLAPPSPAPAGALAEVHDDARVLADYGAPPSSWAGAPLYAWRVLRRQRELKAALAARRTEAAHAEGVVEEALVGLCERVRPAAEKQPALAASLAELGRAEDVLRSRDRVLAADQDAHRARLAQVDERIAKIEAELAQLQTQERLVATDLTATQNSLAREEASLKRAEAELKAALARGEDGAGG